MRTNLTAASLLAGYEFMNEMLKNVHPELMQADGDLKREA